jgi:hypothetical protein
MAREGRHMPAKTRCTCNDCGRHFRSAQKRLRCHRCKKQRDAERDMRRYVLRLQAARAGQPLPDAQPGHASAITAAKAGRDFAPASIEQLVATDERPGTRAKIHILAFRAQHGLPLWHDGDLSYLTEPNE